MKRDSDNFSEYRGNDGSSERDYLHPDYYQQPEDQSPYSAQPVQPLDPYKPYDAKKLYADQPYPDPTPYKYAATDMYTAEQMSEYRGPKSMEGYTVNVGTEQQDAAERGTLEEGGKKKKGWAGIVATLAAIGAWLLKLKGFVFLLKFGGASISALISIAFYSVVFGWPFAIGLVVLLFIHEMGHALVMKLKGIPMGALVFIPLLGAAVTMRQMPQNAQDEAEVGIAGPIAGAISSGVCLLIAELHLSSYPIWAPLAYFGFFINLFNLIPIVPFDGGRVLAAIDRRVWILGFVALLGFQIWQWLQGSFSPWLLLFVIMAATQLWSRGLAAPKTPEEQSYYAVPMGTRISLSLLYFGLVAVLVLGMSISNSLIPLTQ